VVVTWSQEIRGWPVLELERDMPVSFSEFALPASHSRLTSRKEMGSDARSTDDSMVISLCAYEGAVPIVLHNMVCSVKCLVVYRIVE